MNKPLANPPAAAPATTQPKALPPMVQFKRELEQIAAELQGYDPQALSADRVNEFLAQLVPPVTATEAVGDYMAIGSASPFASINFNNAC
jgi:hypothetical protein